MEEQADLVWHFLGMSRTDFSSAIPFMRMGYAVVAGFGLYAIWRGESPDGTAEALRSLETTRGGGMILLLIFLGLLSYAVWRLIDAIWDLEDHGRDAKGVVARIGMVVTGTVHGTIGGLAFSLLFLGGGSEGGSTIAETTARVMSWPAGLWIFGFAGVAIAGAGLYYMPKGRTEKYREDLRANRFTLNWNWMLKGGLIAHGAVIVLIGIFFIVAGWQAGPSETGGLDRMFGWLSAQLTAASL